jgi:hypothetical protein
MSRVQLDSRLEQPQMDNLFTAQYPPGGTEGVPAAICTTLLVGSTDSDASATFA